MSKLFNKLLALKKYGDGICLHRMSLLCHEILHSDWGQQIDPINIVGTNGKGSTAVIITSILNELDISVGLFTSPHLFEFSERIKIDNDKIPVEELNYQIESFYDKIIELKDEFSIDQIGAFEAFTFLGLSHFKHQQTRAIVLEAGIGGRYDPTRIMSGSCVALTSIDFDHTEILGKTKEEIAYDKIDIANPGATVFLGHLDDTLIKQLTSYARLKHIKIKSIQDCTKVGRTTFENNKMILNCSVEELQFEGLVSNLIGYHQVNNILVSILLVKHWLATNAPQIPNSQLTLAVYTALNKINWHGRLERILEDPTVYIDVGHTPKAIEYLVQSYKSIQKKSCLLITGVSHDKNIEAIIPQLVTIADVVVCTRANHKGAQSSIIKKIVSDSFGNEAVVFNYEDITEAIDFSISYARRNNLEILIAGGLFLSIEAFQYIKNKNSKVSFF